MSCSCQINGHSLVNIPENSPETPAWNHLRCAAKLLARPSLHVFFFFCFHSVCDLKVCSHQPLWRSSLPGNGRILFQRNSSVFSFQHWSQWNSAVGRGERLPAVPRARCLLTILIRKRRRRFNFCTSAEMLFFLTLWITWEQTHINTFFSSEFSTFFFQRHNVCKVMKNETSVHSKAVTCNPVAMEVHHLCRLLTGPDKSPGLCLIDCCVSRLLALR